MKKLTYLFILLLMVGCKMGPNYKGVKVESPEKFTQTDVTQDSVINLKWWEMFDDSVLDTVIRQSLEANQDILMTMQRIEQAKAVLRIQRKEWLPKVGIQSETAYGNYLGFLVGDEAYSFLGASTVNWELDFWGKFRRMSESARADLIASEYGQRTLQISLISEVATTYFLLLEYRASYEISVKTLALRDSTVNIIRARYEKGIVPQTDLNQAEIQRAIAASSVPVYRRQIVQTENALNILLGKAPDRIVPEKGLTEQQLPEELPIVIPSQLLARRPDILQAEQQVISQNAQIGVAQAMRLPAINLSALVGFAQTNSPVQTGSGLGWNVGSGLMGPLFHWGQNLRRVEIEKSKTKEMILNYEKTVLSAFREVEDALIEMQTLKEEIVERKAHVTASSANLILSQQRYDKGVTSYLEFLEAQRQDFEAQLNLSTTRQKLLSSYVKLYKALGGGWLSEDEMNAANAEEED